jgi:hypothetical protein
MQNSLIADYCNKLGDIEIEPNMFDFLYEEESMWNGDEVTARSEELQQPSSHSLNNVSSSEQKGYFDCLQKIPKYLQKGIKCENIRWAASPIQVEKVCKADFGIQKHEKQTTVSLSFTILISLFERFIHSLLISI